MLEDPFGLCGATLDGKYRVDSVVGEGGFGIVYRGWHLDFEHPLAIKCLKVPGHFTAAAKHVFLEKFREEGKHLSKLSSQTLASVRAFAFGLSPSRAGEVPYLVLEWLEGSDLERLLSSSPTAFEERDAVELLRPAVEALSCAHRLGIAHRDIKPANLYLARVQEEVQLKVLDFGIAKAMQEGETATQLVTRTSSGFSAFSPRYGAPEQFSPKKLGATGPWTDVHALGLVLCEMLAGRPALEGEEPSEWLMSALAPERPTPRTRGADVGDALEAICARCVALAPKDRYRDAGELLAALDALFLPRRADERATWTPRLPAATPSDAALDTVQYLEALNRRAPSPERARFEVAATSAVVDSPRAASSDDSTSEPASTARVTSAVGDTSPADGPPTEAARTESGESAPPSPLGVLASGDLAPPDAAMARDAGEHAPGTTALASSIAAPSERGGRARRVGIGVALLAAIALGAVALTREGQPDTTAPAAAKDESSPSEPTPSATAPAGPSTSPSTATPTSTASAPPTSTAVASARPLAAKAAPLPAQTTAVPTKTKRPPTSVVPSTNVTNAPASFPQQQQQQQSKKSSTYDRNQ